MKLSTRLVLLFLLISLIPLGAIGYLGYRSGIKAIEQDTVDRLVATNALKAAEVNRWINGAQTQLKALAQRPLVRIYSTILADPKSSRRELGSARRNLLKDHFKPHISYGMGLLDLSILRIEDGCIVASTDTRIESKYREGRAFFIQGQSRTFVDEMAYEVGIEQLVMHISTPIKGSDGQVIAVLAGHLDWQELSQIMAQGVGHSSSEESYLVNKSNYFVTESRFAKDYPLRKTIQTQGVHQCLAQQDGVELYENYRDLPVIGAFRWMPEWRLCLLTEEEQTEALAPAIAFRNVFAGIWVAAAVAAAMFSWLFARTIAGRIQHLVKGAKEIGIGNLDHRIEAKGEDEIDQLARSFNAMARARKVSESLIRKSHDELEDRVRERTAEISHANEKLVKEIIERKQIEGALRESEEKYRDLVENIDTAVVVHAADTRILMSNPRAHDLLGLSGDQMAGREAIDPAWHFCRADGSPMPLEEYPVNRVINSRKALQNYTVGIQHPDIDRVVWVSVNAFPKFDDLGRLEQVVVTFWDITFRKEAQAKLESSLSEKEVLLREIHHRVKNNMQMIQSLINLQANKLKQAEFKQVLRDSNSRIKSMALIHETLYRSEDLASLDLDKYFRQLVKHLLKLYHHAKTPIEINIHIDALMLDMDSSIACGLIVNELVTNALKYAYDNGSSGQLTVALQRLDDQKAELVVADNGKGLSSKVMSANHQSLGLKIVSMLAEDQLQGRMDIDLQSGTQYRIQFPIESTSRG